MGPARDSRGLARLIGGHQARLFFPLLALEGFNLHVAVAFLAVHQCLFGVHLGCTFAPNHKGMPTLRGDERHDFLRRQVLTSRNVRGGLLTDVLLGGLNYQIPAPPVPQHAARRSACPTTRPA
jgi:fatty acid desaturase